MSFLSISSRCRYGILAAVELAKAENTLTISQIAKRQRIPARFLEAILRQLKLAGVVDSIRGKQGGYYLKACPQQVTMGQLFNLLDADTKKVEDNTEHTEINFLNKIFSKASNAYINTLSDVTLNQFVDQIKKQEGTIDFAI